MPRTNRTRLLRTRKDGHCLPNPIDRKLAHAAMVPQRAGRWTVLGARSAGKTLMADGEVPRCSRSEAELGYSWAEDGDDRSSNGGRQMKWCRVVGHQDRSALNQGRRLAERQAAGSAESAPRIGGDNHRCERLVICTANQDAPLIELGHQLLVIRPTLGCPHRAWSQGDKTAAQPMFRQPRF